MSSASLFTAVMEVVESITCLEPTCQVFLWSDSILGEDGDGQISDQTTAAVLTLGAGLVPNQSSERRDLLEFQHLIKTGKNIQAIEKKEKFASVHSH